MTDEKFIMIIVFVTLAFSIGLATSFIIYQGHEHKTFSESQMNVIELEDLKVRLESADLDLKILEKLTERIDDLEERSPVSPFVP